MSNARKKLIEAVTALVNGDPYGGDWRKLFDAFDGDRDGRINSDECHRLLTAAGVGNWWTRENWVKGVMKAMDESGDGKISWVEFLASMNGNGDGEHTGENDVP